MAVIEAATADRDQKQVAVHTLSSGGVLALLDGRHRTLPGSWHGVSEEAVAAAIRDFVMTVAEASGTTW